MSTRLGLDPELYNAFLETHERLSRIVRVLDGWRTVPNSNVELPAHLVLGGGERVCAIAGTCLGYFYRNPAIERQQATAAFFRSVIDARMPADQIDFVTDDGRPVASIHNLGETADIAYARTIEKLEVPMPGMEDDPRPPAPGPFIGGAPNRDPWAHRSVHMRCSTCMFFVPKAVPERLSAGAFQTTPVQIGRCRRHAPTMAGYPAVFPSDWCGDHKIDETKL